MPSRGFPVSAFAALYRCTSVSSISSSIVPRIIAVSVYFTGRLKMRASLAEITPNLSAAWFSRNTFANLNPPFENGSIDIRLDTSMVH